MPRPKKLEPFSPEWNKWVAIIAVDMESIRRIPRPSEDYQIELKRLQRELDSLLEGVIK
jgi:hypothetical protein